MLIPDPEFATCDICKDADAELVATCINDACDWDVCSQCLQKAMIAVPAPLQHNAVRHPASPPINTVLNQPDEDPSGDPIPMSDIGLPPGTPLRVRPSLLPNAPAKRPRGDDADTNDPLPIAPQSTGSPPVPPRAPEPP